MIIFLYLNVAEILVMGWECNDVQIVHVVPMGAKKGGAVIRQKLHCKKPTSVKNLMYMYM